MENKEQNEKLSFSEWLENIWYHSKWMIIFGGMMIIFVVISVIQLVSTSGPDVNILHVGPMYLSSEAIDRIETTLKDFSDDYNDDGDFSISLLDITVDKLSNGQGGTVNLDYNNQALQRFQTEIRAGDASIYALDKYYFDICLKEGLLTPLEEIIDDADMPVNNVKDEKGVIYGVYVSDLDVYSLSGIENFPDTAILCLRRSPEKDQISYGRTQEDWEGNRKTFVKLIKYRDKDKVVNDIDVMYCGFNKVLTEAEEGFESTFTSFADKEDVLFDITSIMLEGNMTSLDPTESNTLAVKEFETELFAGDSMIFLLDKQLFDICVEHDKLASFEEVFGKDNMPEGVIGGCGIYLSSLDVDGLAGFEKLSPNTVLCIRRAPDSETIKYGRLQSAWESNRDIFVKLIEDKNENQG
ncbi:MAG: hypothetical protein IKY21_02345 [Clostridia bacterium]|nr:hypothetical protein [Clostridia bacterium]